MKKTFEILSIAAIVLILLTIIAVIMDKVFMPLYIHHNKELVVETIIMDSSYRRKKSSPILGIKNRLDSVFKSFKSFFRNLW